MQAFAAPRTDGIWDEIREDDKGLWVKGRLLPEIEQAREAAALIAATRGSLKKSVPATTAA